MSLPAAAAPPSLPVGQSAIGRKESGVDDDNAAAEVRDRLPLLLGLGAVVARAPLVGDGGSSSRKDGRSLLPVTSTSDEEEDDEEDDEEGRSDGDA